jgi:hypothetical protein
MFRVKQRTIILQPQQCLNFCKLSHLIWFLFVCSFLQGDIYLLQNHSIKETPSDAYNCGEPPTNLASDGTSENYIFP